jgi:hypothetical protein
VVEGAALEMLYRGNFIEGSNPSLSALKNRSLGPVFLCYSTSISITFPLLIIP